MFLPYLIPFVEQKSVIAQSYSSNSNAHYQIFRQRQINLQLAKLCFLIINYPEGKNRF